MSRNLYKQIDFKKNIKMYWEFASPYKWLFFVVILLATLLEVIHITEKYLFKLILDRGAEFVAGTLVQSALTKILLVIAILYIGMALTKVANHWFRQTILNKVESEMIFDLKKKFFDHIVHLSHNFHTTHKTGSLISRLNRGAGAVERLSDFFVYNVVPLLLQIIIIGISLISLNWQAAIVIVLTCVIFIIYGLYVSHIQKEAHVAANRAEDYEKGTISDVFTNIDSIKYYGKEYLIKNRYKNISTDTKRTRLRFWNYGRLFGAGQSLILAIGTFFVIYFPLLKFLDGSMSIGTLAFIYTVYTGLVGLLFGFVHGIRGYYISLGDLDDLFEYAKIKNEIKDSSKKKIEIKKGEIEFDNISFSYPQRGDEQAIKNLSLKINKNEKVALVGHSGCGKTTLIKLLYRLYDTTSGKIKIDGEETKNFNQESLRSELSIVPQEAILFDDTIYNNILFSSPKATRAEVMKAMKFAQLDVLLEKLPKKEKTIVGERGVKLSGGEKQRVSIARAILADKKILVLDEATSALDSKTEYEIQNDLERLMKGRTSIIIAHRLSTIMKADKIVVMDKGKVVQIGKHYDLIKRPGIYKELWNLQKGGYLKE